MEVKQPSKEKLMRRNVYAFMLTASLFCCLGCGNGGFNTDNGGKAQPNVAEWIAFEAAKQERNVQGQIQALETILAQDPNAVDPNGLPVAELLKIKKAGK